MKQSDSKEDKRKKQINNLEKAQDKINKMGNQAMGIGCLILVVVGLFMFLFSWIKC